MVKGGNSEVHEGEKKTKAYNYQNLYITSFLIMSSMLSNQTKQNQEN